MTLAAKLRGLLSSVHRPRLRRGPLVRGIHFATAIDHGLRAADVVRPCASRSPVTSTSNCRTAARGRDDGALLAAAPTNAQHSGADEAVSAACDDWLVLLDHRQQRGGADAARRIGGPGGHHEGRPS
ncbi:hypothetical protein [Streptomyces globosus]|uniref:hypothetical protein n=1 Tax=Streptomyces globosus TaxID=68209 RepID=UPI00362D7349